MCTLHSLILQAIIPYTVMQQRSVFWYLFICQITVAREDLKVRGESIWLAALRRLHQANILL